MLNGQGSQPITSETQMLQRRELADALWQEWQFIAFEIQRLHGHHIFKVSSTASLQKGRLEPFPVNNNGGRTRGKTSAWSPSSCSTPALDTNLTHSIGTWSTSATPNRTGYSCPHGRTKLQWPTTC